MINQLGLLFLLIPVTAAHADWGRLFYSPEQRATLNRQAIASAPAVFVHFFNGETQRSGGKPLRWVDEKLSPEKPPKQVKPGERWDSTSGTVYPAGHTPDEE